jgi:hypothetical protein
MPQYPLTDQDTNDLKNRFTYHAPKADQPERYVKLRDKAYELAVLIKENTPTGRQQSLALTALEEVTMRANAAIAQGE